MSLPNTIQRSRALPLPQDYEALRKMGMAYVEQFAHALWTDYNVHDPGITTLEALCYAITDLGYRTAMPVEDLIARPPGDATKDFFTAREILPCNPVTFEDLRKKIIDIAGVQNAWIQPWTDGCCDESVQYPAYYIHCEHAQRRFHMQAHAPLANAGLYEARALKGLYHFVLLLEEDPVLGDLNIPVVDFELNHTGTGQRLATVRFTFPVQCMRHYPAVPGAPMLSEQLATAALTGFSISNFRGSPHNTFDLVLQTASGNFTIEQVAYQVRPVQTGLEVATVREALQERLQSADAAVRATLLATVFQRFAAKVAKVMRTIDAVSCMYQRVRNVCEDVIRISIAPAQEIAICADIETEPGTDLEQVLGTLFFEIDTFFSPPVPFLTLAEMLEKGYSTDTIFEGPLLQHGFIEDAALQQKSLFRYIHLSDLYRILMAIPGVRSVKHLQITNYLHGLPQTEGIPSHLHPSWTLDLHAHYHLNLDRNRSKITFYKGNVPITADKHVANRIYADLKAAIARPRPNADFGISNDLPEEKGTLLPLTDYYSVQNEFPATYGVGPDGIPAQADMQRKTHIKQFKGYLLFFDQLMVNYLAQLQHLKDLYAVQGDTPHSYQVQPVYDTPVNKPDEDRNFFDIAPLLQAFAMPGGADIDNEQTYLAQWQAFAETPLGADNAYMQALRALAESEPQAEERRNRFLDHLLARFAEEFSSYAAAMYLVQSAGEHAVGQSTAAAIAEDKQNFLKDYPMLSYNRGKGQYVKECCTVGSAPPAGSGAPTYAAQMEYDFFTVPHPAHPAGIQLRGSRMLGIHRAGNIDLVSSMYVPVETAPGVWGYTIQYHLPEDALQAQGTYATQEAAFAAMEQLSGWLLPGNAADRFPVVLQGGRWRVRALSPTGTVVAQSTVGFATRAAALAGRDKLWEVLRKESLFMIDHLLLRPLPVAETVHVVENPGMLPPNDPRLDDVGFFPLCEALNPDCNCPETDYYSFRVSFYLPYWSPRLRSMDFRKFAAATLHRETPAHVLPKFCWISMYDMWRLEQAYFAWFAENSKYTPDVPLLAQRLRRLITVMNTLRNVYPEGRLHDCENPGNHNPVILNETMLGSF